VNYLVKDTYVPTPGSVSVINTKTNQVIATVPVGYSPENLTDANKMNLTYYVGLDNPEKNSMINSAEAVICRYIWV
jgi:YVTN family beta-propeller protein